MKCPILLFDHFSSFVSENTLSLLNKDSSIIIKTFENKSFPQQETTLWSDSPCDFSRK